MARKPQGRFLGLPFNWSRPSREDLGRGLWDPDDPRIFTPKNVGWGYGLNFAALLRRGRSGPPGGDAPDAPGDAADPPPSDLSS